MCKDDYWELKGQLLILCSNALLYFHTVEEEIELEIDQINETSNEHSKVQTSNEQKASFEKSPAKKSIPHY